MAFTKYASLDAATVLDVKGTPTRQRTASLDKVADYHNYRTGDGYMYVRMRAISSRVNKNNDGWPTVELAGSPELFERHQSSDGGGFTIEASEGGEYGFATFMGKPHFVDHHNSDPKRARGVVVDAKFHMLGNSREAALDEYYSSDEVDAEHLPPCEVELLIEVDAKSFPKLAQAIQNGDIDGFSMGCDVEKSKCSHCGNEATSPDEYCSHIVMKGAQMKVESGKHKGKSRKSYENCYGIKFFEISAVFDPADETALTKEVRSSVTNEGMDKESEYQYVVKRGDKWVILQKGTGKVLSTHASQEEAEAAFRAMMANKHGNIHVAENPLPQSDHTTAPAEVDTLRQEQVCPVCGSDMDKETCDVCGFVEPPKHFDNPNLEKAKLRDEALEMGGGQTTVPEDADAGGNSAPAQGATQPGSFLQAEKAKKSGPPAGVMSSMRWEPKLNPKVAGKINQIERPVRPVSRPVTDEPNETVTSDPGHPVTSAFRTAQDMIQAAKRNQGEQMSTRVADAASGAPAVATPDKRVDVTGVGGVMEDSNDAASHADAQVNVMGTGGTGVEGVEADEHMTLPTASPDSNDSGFNHDKTTDDSGHTKTWGDGKGKFKQKSPVTTEHPYWVNENKWSSLSPEQRTAITLIAGDDKVWPPDEISGGSANQGVQPVDPVGKADKRVDVLEHVTSPANNSGPTKQWTGTGGNGVTRQQDPVTRDVIKSNGLPVGGQSMISAHMVTAMKLADTEIELGMLDKEYKYARIAELENWDTNVLRASLTAYTKVKTAGLNKTAAKSPMRLPSFKRATAAVDTQAPEPVDESDLDSALFSR